MVAKVKKHVFGPEEKSYTRIFIFVLVFGLIFYISTIASISVSVMMGAVPFLLFAFGVLLILGNAVTFLSAIFRINLHVLAMIIAFIAGLFYEPHYTQLPDKKKFQQIISATVKPYPSILKTGLICVKPN